MRRSHEVRLGRGPARSAPGADAKATRVPSDLRAELTRRAIALAAWVGAAEVRLRDLPALSAAQRGASARIRRASRRAENDYDVLLDDFDEGMKTTEVRAVFDELKTELIPLIAEITERADAVDNSCLTGHFPMTNSALRPQGARAARLRRRVVAARSDRPPVRDERGDDRHPSHHALRPT